eukprot:TRINITY_DN4336_c0_g1_i1.p1 TRINITY_DN4336_c0_g1~~TRINITY_DN4336_c0_g1_i1.p1  ORF type:complete len:221 (+),score=24.68 TRINITY_DN4336_c0_g1_i1:53-715(+)
MIHSSVGGDFISTSSKFAAGSWPPAISGDGVAVQGTVVEVRNHSLQDQSNKTNRYVSVVLDVETIRTRKFDSGGKEIETAPPTDKAVGKGYINKFDHKSIDDPYRISPDTYLGTTLKGNSMPYYESQDKKLHPHVPDRFEFWGEPAKLKPMDIKKGAVLKLKTKGDSIFVDSCSVLKANAANYSGEDVLGGWTSKISASKDQEKKVEVDNREGADDSEWD